MVQIRQNDEEIMITIKLNRLIIKKPDIVLMPTYIKFNNPPIFFERHLMNEIDETASFCRIFKNEARIVLIKKHKSTWPELFQTLSKEELLLKRIEISDKIVERNKEREKKAIERYEQKKRSEIDKEVQRESEMRERLKQFEDNACREILVVGNGNDKQNEENTVKNSQKDSKIDQPFGSIADVRSSGKINFQFSNYNLRTPKRQSQELYGKSSNEEV